LFELVSGQREYLSEFLWWPQTIRTLDDARQYLASVGQEMKKGSALNYFIFQGGRLSGGCGFSLQMKYTRAEMGFWLEKESQGQGIMSRCLTTMIRYGFEELGLHRLELRIAPENTRSLTLARKMHFLTEGRMRDALRIGGSYQDMIVHALLKREWTEYQSRPEM
jgi:ribosomal-protein-serine acetyltransferase